MVRAGSLRKHWKAAASCTVQIMEGLPTNVNSDASLSWQIDEGKVAGCTGCNSSLEGTRFWLVEQQSDFILISFSSLSTSQQHSELHQYTSVSMEIGDLHFAFVSSCVLLILYCKMWWWKSHEIIKPLKSDKSTTLFNQIKTSGNRKINPNGSEGVFVVFCLRYMWMRCVFIIDS